MGSEAAHLVESHPTTLWTLIVRAGVAARTLA